MQWAENNLNFRFLGSEDKDNFFTRAQRSRMVYEILSATTFGREKKGEVMVYYSFVWFFWRWLESVSVGWYKQTSRRRSF